ncbi:MAG TPA: multicopper oxidase domain-containing protein [Acidimicrobiales bacterium]
MKTTTHAGIGSFPTDPAGLPAPEATRIVELADGDTYDLRITPIANRVGDDTVRMLGYNGSVPGPTLRVRQGSEIAVRVLNDGDHETTVHWHGLRLANQYDGVPFETQPPIPVGGEFTYRLRFPDDGLYWYHPHVREDYGLEMGLYGAILVDPADPEAWAPVDQEVVATLDDVLIEDGRIASFSAAGPTYTAMGRFGNVMLTSGETDLRLAVRTGSVVRFFVVNTANTRIFNVSIPGARMKLVGGDNGRYEHEAFVDAVLLAPSERAAVDVLFTSAGVFAIEHNTPTQAYRLGEVVVAGEPGARSRVETFERLRDNDELARERARLADECARVPDKTLVFDAEMPLLYGGEQQQGSAWTCPMHPEVVSDTQATCPKCGMKLIAVVGSPSPTDSRHGMELGGHVEHGDTGDGLEWEDLMPDINARADGTNMIWKLVDRETGKVNHAIDWTFRVADRVKIRLVNTMDSDHPMHHPFHVHGVGRFLVIAREDVPASNLVWKDTVLVRSGETVDIVLHVTEPGRWMAHCHIAEHNQNGMMFSLDVEPG